MERQQATLFELKTKHSRLRYSSFMLRIRVITIKFLFQEDLEMTGVPQVDEGFEWSNEALLPVVSLDGAATFEHARSVAPLQVLAAQAAAKAGPFANPENRRLVFGVSPV